MSVKIAKHIFNQSVIIDKLPNKDIINDIGIYWTGVTSGKPFYNIEKKDVSDDEIKNSTLSLDNGVFTVENKHPEFTIGDVLKPFDLLVKLRFKGDKERAESYLIEQGYSNISKYIENLIFDYKGNFDAFKTSEFLKSDGYMRVSEQGRDETIVYKVDNGIMREVNINSDTVSLLRKKLKGNPRESVLSNELHKSRARVNSVWSLLDGVPYDLQMDTKEST